MPSITSLSEQARGMMHDIRLKLFERIQSRTMRFFDRQPIGRLVTRTTNDIENLNELFKSVLVTVFKDAFSADRNHCRAPLLELETGPHLLCTGPLYFYYSHDVQFHCERGV